MKILVTGASGGLGKALVAAWVRRQLSVRAMIHRAALNVPGCETVSGDLNRPESLDRAVDGMDTVVHLAALTHSHREKDYFEINVRGTQRLIDACVRNKVKRFIFISSGAAHPRGGAYSRSKLEAEDCVKQSGLPWIILRPSEVYGPGTREGIAKLVHWIKNFPVIPVIGDGRYRMSPVFVEDVISAVIESTLREDLEGRTFVLAGPETLTFTELIDRLSGYLRVRRCKIYLPVFLVQSMAVFFSLIKKDFITPDQIPRLLCEKSSDIGPASEMLDFHPRTLEEGLRYYLAPKC